MKNSQRVVIIGREFSGFSLENLLGGGSVVQTTGEDKNTTVIFAHPDLSNNRLSFPVEPN